MQVIYGLLCEERRRKRENLLEATERTLANIAAAAARRKPGLARHDQAMKAIGREANRHKIEKHFEITVTDDGVSWSRREGRIAEEAGLDGIYVIRTRLESASLGAKAKADTKRIPDGLPVHSFTTLLSDLGTLTLNHASLPGRPDNRFLLASEPTELQARAFELLGMAPDRDAYINVTV